MIAEGAMPTRSTIERRHRQLREFGIRAPLVPNAEMLIAGRCGRVRVDHELDAVADDLGDLILSVDSTSEKP